MSIRRRLMLVLLIPLSALLFLSEWNHYHTALQPTNDAYDHALAEAALEVDAHLRMRDGKPYINFTPVDESVLRMDQVDTIYFAVLDADGGLIAGDEGLPRAPPGDWTLRYVDARYRDEPIRAALYRPPTQAGRITVVAAETTRKREENSRRTIVAMLESSMMVFAATFLLLLLGVRFGLKPLERLASEIGTRSARDLRPLPLAQIPREAQPLAHTLNRLLRLLDESSDAQQRFLSNAAHQLRTPLAGLRTQIELALADDDENARSERLRSLDEASARLSHLVTQLLALAKSDPNANRASQQQQRIDLKSIVESGAAAYHSQATAKDTDLGFELASAPALGVAWQVRELLDNVVDNALAYTPPGGVVTVRCGARGGGAFLEVEDNGPGIRVEERSKVFDHFYRVPGTGGVGCGLGLAIVKEIADVHHASVTIDTPAAGRGTWISISFPSVAAVERS